MTRHTRVLVAGIGNIFLGDDGFGVEVARRLRDSRLPEGVEVVDFGIRGVHLAYELAGHRHDAVILVDAVARGGTPGTLYVIDAEDGTAPPLAGTVDPHSLTPAAVLAWLRRIGGRPAPMTIVGCEPGCLDQSMGLSAPVAAAVDEAMRMVLELVAALERNERSCA